MNDLTLKNSHIFWLNVLTDFLHANFLLDLFNPDKKVKHFPMEISSLKCNLNN